MRKLAFSCVPMFSKVMLVVEYACIQKGYWFLWVNFVSSHFAKIFMNCNFLVEFLSSLIYTVMSSENSDTLTFSFLIYILFMSFSCILLVEIQVIHWRYWKSGQLCLVPGLCRNSSSFFPFILIRGIGLLYITYIVFIYDHSISFFFKRIIKGLHFVKHFWHLMSHLCEAFLSIF